MKCLINIDGQFDWLETQVRDAALKIKDELPKSDVNREYYLQVGKERNYFQNVKLQTMILTSIHMLPSECWQRAGWVGVNRTRRSFGQVAQVGKQILFRLLEDNILCVPIFKPYFLSHKSELLQKLARTTPYYKRNRPHICSFWVKGECKRGEECPYRHEKPSDPDDPLSQQNFKDRYYGVNDPVAEKLLKRAQAMPHLEPPEDVNITTLYCGGLDENVTEADIKNAFYSFGELRNITLVPKQVKKVILESLDMLTFHTFQGCAFVQFTQRKSAEKAAEGTFNKLLIKGNKITIRLKISHKSFFRSSRQLERIPGGASLRGRLQWQETQELDRWTLCFIIVFSWNISCDNIWSI